MGIRKSTGYWSSGGQSRLTVECIQENRAALEATRFLSDLCLEILTRFSLQRVGDYNNSLE